MNMPWFSHWSALRASLASSHKVSIREGFEWTEVEPPVGYVLQGRRRGGRRLAVIDRRAGRQASGSRTKERQRGRTTGL